MDHACGTLLTVRPQGVCHCDIKPDNILLDANGASGYNARRAWYASVHTGGAEITLLCALVAGRCKVGDMGAASLLNAPKDEDGDGALRCGLALLSVHATSASRRRHDDSPRLPRRGAPVDDAHMRTK